MNKSENTQSINTYDLVYEPLNWQGLKHGRMLTIKHRQTVKRQIIVGYGHHATLERWLGVVENFADFGDVIMPDMPGFGGMESFKVVDKEITLDNYADYLADIVRTYRNPNQKVVFAGLSFGFIVITRMLQRHPELTENVETVVCAAGFVHHTDFRFSPLQKRLLKGLSSFGGSKFGCAIIRRVVLRPALLRPSYKRHFRPLIEQEKAKQGRDISKEMVDREIELWQSNDVTTHWQTTKAMLTLDNTGVSVMLPIWHIYSDHDKYFNHQSVRSNLKKVYSEYRPGLLNVRHHSPSILATKEECAGLIPVDLRSALTTKN